MDRTGQRLCVWGGGVLQGTGQNNEQLKGLRQRVVERRGVSSRNVDRSGVWAQRHKGQTIRNFGSFFCSDVPIF